jgi:hypothetical protein
MHKYHYALTCSRVPRATFSMLSLWKKRLSARYHLFYSAGGLDGTLGELLTIDRSSGALNQSENWDATQTIVLTHPRL